MNEKSFYLRDADNAWHMQYRFNLLYGRIFIQKYLYSKSNDMRSHFLDTYILGCLETEHNGPDIVISC